MVLGMPHAGSAHRPLRDDQADGIRQSAAAHHRLVSPLLRCHRMYQRLQDSSVQKEDDPILTRAFRLSQTAHQDVILFFQAGPDERFGIIRNQER